MGTNFRGSRDDANDEAAIVRFGAIRPTSRSACRDIAGGGELEPG